MLWSLFGDDGKWSWYVHELGMGLVRWVKGVREDKGDGE